MLKSVSAISPLFMVVLILILYEISYFISVNTLFVPEISSHHSLLNHDETQFASVMSYLERISNWGYFIIPVIIMIKLTMVTFFIQLPFLLNSLIITYKKYFKIIVYASLFLAIGECIRVLRISFIESHQTNWSKSQFLPFGIIDLVNVDFYEPTFLVILNYFNIFELGWFFVVYFGLKKIAGINKQDALIAVTSVWILIILINWGFAYCFYQMATVT